MYMFFVEFFFLLKLIIIQDYNLYLYSLPSKCKTILNGQFIFGYFLILYNIHIMSY